MFCCNELAARKGVVALNGVYRDEFWRAAQQVLIVVYNLEAYLDYQWFTVAKDSWKAYRIDVS